MKLDTLNLDQFLTKNDVHGFQQKDMLVLHETVSGDIVGLADIIGVAKYLAQEDFFIHGMTDLEGHMAWAHGYGNAIFWQCGGVNERSDGIEQVSYIPALLAAKKLTLAQAYKHWCARTAQLHATAKLVAAWHHSDRAHHPLRFSDGLHPGVTSHWNVSQHFKESQGHTDCWPHHLGGYYPILLVIELAQAYASQGVTF